MKKNILYDDLVRFSDFKELINLYKTKYKDVIAFEYRDNADSTDFTKVTYGQFANDIEDLAVSLLKNKCERVAIISHNRYEWCVSYLAVTSSGLIAIPLDKSLPIQEIENSLKRSNADTIIFENKYSEAAKICKNQYCMDDDSFKNLLRDGHKSSHEKYDEIVLNPKEMSILLFTSGTTSMSKIVMLTQHALLENLCNFSQMYRVPIGTKFLSFLPLHHTFESTITFLYGTSIGLTICFCDGLKYISKDLKDFEIEGFVCVPLMLEVMYKKIIKQIDAKEKTQTVNRLKKLLRHAPIGLKRLVFKSVINGLGGHLKYLVAGGAPMDPDTVQGYNDFGFDLSQGYGLTETCSAIACENFKDKRVGSVGLAMPNNKIKIYNPDKDGIGEIIVKTESVMLGYYNNEEATKEAFDDDGFFHTGDLGRIDKDGFIFITGRKKDMIVLKNGKKIFPEELEFLINQLPGISESMVFGHIDDTKNDRNADVILCAKLVYKKDSMKKLIPDGTIEDYQKYLEKEIKEKINVQMPPYKYIRKIIVTEEPLIKTTTLKIKRNEEMKRIQL